MLSGVCVVTPVPFFGRRCPLPAGRESLDKETGQIGKAVGGASGWAQSMAEGENKNRGKKEKYQIQNNSWGNYDDEDVQTEIFKKQGKSYELKLSTNIAIF